MDKATLTWRDVGLRERLTVIASVSGAPDTVAALRVLSNATLSTLSSGAVVTPDFIAPLDGQLPDLDDIWVIVCMDAGSYKTHLYVPAPLASTAISDGINADMLSEAWLNLATVIPAAAVPFTQASLQEIVAATIARDAPNIYQTWQNFGGEGQWARRTLQWAGVHGVQRLTHLVGLHDSLGADFSALADGLVAVSNARVEHYWEGDMYTYNDTPTTDQYNSVRDHCTIMFADEDGNQTEVTLPAPARVIFLADGKTLNVAQVNVATFIAAALTELIVPVSGQPVALCVGGHLGKQAVY